MLKIINILAMMITISLFNTVQAYCISDFIKDKTADGSFIVLESGSSWRVDFVDMEIASAWEAGEEVSVCDDHDMINHDSDDEKVNVRKIN